MKNIIIIVLSLIAIFILFKFISKFFLLLLVVLGGYYAYKYFIKGDKR